MAIEEQETKHDRDPELAAPAAKTPDGERAGWGLTRAWRRVRSRWWGRVATELALVAAVVMAVSWYQARDLLGDGVAAPTFELQSLDGPLIDMADYRGEKVLVAFWAPWCTVCGLEMHNLSAMHEAGRQVVSVVLAYEDLESVRAFVDEHALDFPVLLGDERVQRAYAVRAFPTLYVLDEEGVVEDAIVGYTTEIGLRWRVGF